MTKKQKSKKTISPIISITLLLLVVIVAIAGFQNWFNNFQTNILSDVSQKSILKENTQIKNIIGNSIYLKNNEKNLTISEIKIGNKICNSSNKNLKKGFNKINLENCSINNGIQKITILTNKGLLKKEIYIKNSKTKQNSNKPQKPKETYFFKTLNTTQNDLGTSITTTSDKGFIIAGNTQSYGNNNYNILLSKFDSNGIEQWSKTIGNSNNDQVKSIIQTLDKGYAIIGETNSYGGVDSDIIISKLDSNGIEQWTKIIGNQYPDVGTGIIQTTDNGYIITGYTQSYGNTDHDIIISKLNSNGIEQWTKVIQSSQADFSNSIAKTSENGFVITGKTSNFGGDDADIYLAKFDSNGIKQWIKTINGTKIDLATSVIQTTDNGYIITGNSRSYGTSGKYDIIITKFNSNGIEQWTKTIGGTNHDLGKSIIETTNNNLILIGATSSYGGDDYDILISKLNSQGIEQWTKLIGKTKTDMANSITLTHENSIIITGQTQSYGGDDTDLLILKLDSNGNCNQCNYITSIDLTEKTHNAKEENHNFNTQNIELTQTNIDLTENNINTIWEKISSN